MKYIDLINNDRLADGLLRQGIKEPTQVQERVYTPIQEGRDIIVRSQTGTGKTLAYLIPLIQKIDFDARTNQIMILVPTYELAIQVNNQINALSDNTGIDIGSAVLIGNGNINRQMEALKSKPFIVIGTAGRILELIQKKKIAAHTIKSLVIDEADKLLDKKNIELITSVRKCLMRDTQTLFFSASIDNKAIQTATELSHEPDVITMTEKISLPDNIEHQYIMVGSKRDKINTLRSLCSSLKKKNAMIFINTQYDIEQAYERLTYRNYKVGMICGSNNKNERKNVINAFKSHKLDYLIATDIASRGLHIDGVETVINVSVPENPLDYLHRAGRCGRNLPSGTCISIITASELYKIKSIQKEFKITFKEKKLAEGKLI